jgi:hypothetical protein
MLTRDRAPDAFFTTEKIGRTQELTPEGFLLCRDVLIARTGEMLYLPGECGLEAGADGIVRVFRGPEDLFRPETIASFTGKAITDDHPEDDVTPDNLERDRVGVMLNPRQGEGEDADCLVVDLLIKTRRHRRRPERQARSLVRLRRRLRADSARAGDGNSTSSATTWLSSTKVGAAPAVQSRTTT